MADKIRLDLFLKNKFGFSRQYIKQIITEEKVIVNGKIIKKAAFGVNENDEITLTESIEPKYVGRGGFKLEGALKAFSVSLEDMVCIDIGSSTGGFTDCMLQNGASLVYAVDVGTDQLAEKLKNDKRVISMEKTDIRDVDIENVDGGADFIGTDVSFISLKKIADSIKELLNPEGSAIVLVKPQFEAGKENLTKNGIVKNPKVHKKVLKDIINFYRENGLFTVDFTFSPITGGDGNIEYLLYLTKKEDKQMDITKISDKIINEVETAFNSLKGA